ncbi:general stress protein [Massilia sp. Root335]|uniref:general stress protein n=1 Tax=Massilia sp. Root335 TaxID=1736517 RepID=UPI000B20909B|nr:general stress protein [Massilia sp. Root335]
MRHTLVAVFDNRSDARNALDELLASGFARTDVSISSADPTGQSNSVTGEDERLAGEHEEGFGASLKHFFTTLFGSDTNEHAMKYSYAVTRGHHVLTLTTDSEPEVERAADIIERFGPVDIDEHHDEWTRGAAAASPPASAGLQQSGSMSAQSGGMGSASGSTASSSGSYQGTPAGTEPGSLQFTGHDDRNFFGMQNINDPVPKGQTYEEPQGANEQSGGSMDSATGGNTLSGTQSSAQNPATGSSLQSAQGGSLNQSGSTLQGTASIPGSDDTSLGGTAMMGNRSGSLQRDSTLSGSQQRDVGARGNVRVYSRDTGADSTYDDTFRNDWNRNYASGGGSYDDYAPAYRFGNEMRRDEKYRDRDWSDVEQTLRSDWEARNPGASTWDKFKAAVRHGWDRFKPDMDEDDWYHSDWHDNYSSLGAGFDEYAPAYRYGTEMRTSTRYRDRSWDEVESDLRSDWDKRHPGASTWDKFKAAVRRGWDKITPDIDDDSYYRSHWNAKYSNASDKYDDYLPAYRYGDEARRLQKYRSRHWDDAQADLKADWESRYTSGTSTWDKFKDAVRHGWNKITPDMDESTYYHTHYESTYAASGTDYDDVAPAYRYGNEMRSSDAYRDRAWDDVEGDLKNDWHSKYGAHDEPSAWERIKAAVRHGWDKMTGETAGTDDDTHYRTHWSDTYSSTGTSYDDTAPAYRYGAQMRNDVRYRNRDWSDVENDLRSDWDARYGKDSASTWDKMKAAVRHGWDRATL